MEITHESHLEEIRNALYQTGNATGVYAANWYKEYTEL